jgi:hypothetical protein
MGKIYRTADKTIVWLGEKSDDSDDAIEFLNWLGWHFYSGTRLDSERIEEAANRSGRYHRQWTAVESLFQRPW